MKFIKKVSDYAMVGGLGALLVTSFSGCNDNSSQNNSGSGTVFSEASQKQGAFVIIEKDANENYNIIDEYPASKTTIILRDAKDGSERILSQDEIDALVAKENTKIENGTSGLTNPSMSSGGLSLGEVLLSSMAGAIIGSWIGGKLFNNQNYQNQRSASYKSPQTYSKSVNSFNKTSSTSTKSTSSTKSGFFGSSSKTSSGTSSFGG